MNKKKIVLPEISVAREFVATAEKCDFDIDICYNRYIVDAKSLLGVLSMDLTKPLTVSYYGEDESFEDFLDRHAAA